MRSLGREIGLHEQDRGGAAVLCDRRKVKAVPGAGLAGPLLTLQQQAGNQAVQELLRSGVIRAKLAVSTPGDPDEQEADRVAGKIMRSHAGFPGSSSCSCASGEGVCEECQQKQQGVVARVAESAPDTDEAPARVTDVLRLPGQPLPESARVPFERKLGHDLSAVRIHDDSAAAESASAVNALAYTLGHHIVFGVGHYAPGTEQGDRLLAHELTHTIQQGGSGPTTNIRQARRAESRSDPVQHQNRRTIQRVHLDRTGRKAFDCLDYAGDKKLEACLNDEDRLSPGEHSPTVAKLQNGLLRDGADLGKEGADGKYGAATGQAVMAFKSKYHLGFEQFPDVGPGTMAKLDELCASRPAAPIHVPEVQVTGIGCPPTQAVKAADLVDYVALMECAETKMGLSPREMLTLFRQLYYGSQAWSKSINPHWDEVVTCPTNVGDPKPKLGQALFDSLRASQEVGGVDVGHVFAGLEAMMCPAPSVVANKWYAPTAVTTINMSNEEFATWGGDLGAAVAARAACERLGTAAASEEDCGKVVGPQALPFYLRWHAPDTDLQGDIDPFALRASLLGIPCGGSAQKTATLWLSPGRKLSDVFSDYYTDGSTSLGKAHGNNVRCFLDVIGAQLDQSGKQIINKSSIVGPIADRVANFAQAFYYKITSSLPDAGEMGLMRYKYSPDAVDWFLAWLEHRLP